MPKSLGISRLAEPVLLFFLTFTVLWKGGKSLESTWLLVFVAYLCTVAYWRIQRGKSSSHFLGVSPLVWNVGFAFICWSALSYVFSLTRNYGLDEPLRDTSLFFLLLFAARTTLERKEFVQKLVSSVAVITLLACVVGIVVYVLQPVDRMVGSFLDFRFHTDYWPNAWAEYLLLSWPAVLYAALHAHVNRSRSLWMVGLGLLLACLLLSYSRGAILALTGQVLLLGVLILWGKRRSGAWSALGHLFHRAHRSHLQWLIVPIFALVLFFTVNLARQQFFPVQSVEAKITFTAAEGDSSKTERVAFWKQSFQLSLERPLFGWGPYSFRFVQPYLQESVWATADHPHNVLLKLAMERGYPAALLYLVLLLSILFPAFRRVFRSGDVGRDALLLIAVLGVLAHNMIDYNLQFVGIAMGMWLFLGILAAQDTREPRISRTAALVSEIIVMSLVLIFTVGEGRELILSSLGRHAEATGDITQAIEWYRLAENERFSRDMGLGRANLLLEQHKPAEAVAVLQDYAKRNALDYRLWKLMGQAHVAMGNPQEALADFQRALQGGRENDLSILLLTVQTADAAQEPELVTNADVLQLLRHYRTAMMKNLHFIDLSPNVEAFTQLSSLMERRDPVHAQDYRSVAEEVTEHALTERKTTAARRPGFLWR